MPRRTWISIGAVSSALGLLLAPLAVRADPAAATTPHVVQAGEKLSANAIDAGVDTAAVGALNGPDAPNPPVAPHSLKRPVAPAAPAAAAAPPPASPTYCR